MIRSEHLYIEVSTLLDPPWSGIANVTANLCRSLLDATDRVSFFAYDRLLKSSFVKTALDANDGESLDVLFRSGHAVAGPLMSRPVRAGGEIGIFPNFRRGYQRFGLEALIVHDLSFILLPELHDGTRVADYTAKLFRDIHAVDSVCCVSAATRRDVIRYFGAAADKVHVTRLGVDGGRGRVADTPWLSQFGLRQDEFFLILGTIEPRKNVGLVLECVRMNPELLSRKKFVFVGREGWGPPFAALRRRYECDDARIVHLGYLPEEDRKGLLQSCAALIFPSLFEGFGLPVIEAMSFGTPVIAAETSSVVEFGLASEYMFDPISVESLGRAIDRFLRLGPDVVARLRIENKINAKNFTWAKFRDDVLSSIPGGVG